MARNTLEFMKHLSPSDCMAAIVKASGMHTKYSYKMHGMLPRRQAWVAYAHFYALEVKSDERLQKPRLPIQSPPPRGPVCHVRMRSQMRTGRLGSIIMQIR